MRRGKLGADVSQEEGYRTARALALKMLATIKHHVGDLDRVERVIKVLGMINAVPEFETHNKVLDGASDLFYEVFGPDIGCHGSTSGSGTGEAQGRTPPQEGHAVVEQRRCHPRILIFVPDRRPG